MISRLRDAHHFWRQGHQTFSGFIKARERPQKRRTGRRSRARKTGLRTQQKRQIYRGRQHNGIQRN
ncbi:hypothetical protein NC651_004985 [Populus alba x Populus x berolinensis]|nr:hypothetical protein NC651_004985 [Populus alba x Populus x berolinensis]